MLSVEELNKQLPQIESIFREENEGRHVTLQTNHSTFRSGTIVFEFDIHIKTFQLTTDRNDNLSLLIFMECRNATLKNLYNDTEYPLPEPPTIEYYENLTNEKPGQFEITNKNEIIFDPMSYDRSEASIEINELRKERIFDYYEKLLNEDSNYNINLSRIMYQEEIQNRAKAEQLRKEAEQKEQDRLAKKEKRAENIKNIKTSAVALGGVTAAVALTPIVPIILLTGVLGYCVANLITGD